MKDYYGQIDAAIRRYEECKPKNGLNIHWISDRISWCWKFHKITEKEMNELSERVISILNSGIIEWNDLF